MLFRSGTYVLPTGCLLRVGEDDRADMFEETAGLAECEISPCKGSHARDRPNATDRLSAYHFV